MTGEKQFENDVIEKILAIELEMFLSVPTEGTYACQQYPESFKIHRRAQFCSWSLPTQESYLHDLERAVLDGINLMTKKYARMDNLIEPLNSNPVIDIITGIQCEWQHFMKEKYPGIINRGRPLTAAEDSAFMTSFETYIRSELETYSDRTLELLHQDIQDKLKQGINMTEEVYRYLTQQMGYSSLEEAEQYALSHRED